MSRHCRQPRRASSPADVPPRAARPPGATRPAAASRPARSRAVRGLAGALAVLLAGALGAAAAALPATVAQAAGRGLELRFALDGYVGVEQAGNTLLSCPAGSNAGGEPCATAQAGGGVDNDGFAMSYVDTDDNPATVNSSTAQVQAPPGAAIAFAGLYWGGDSGAANPAGVTGCQSTGSAGQVTAPPAPGRIGQVLVNIGGKGYVGVGASTLDTLPSSLGGALYQGFADVTPLFARYSGGAKATTVPVTVANVQLARGRNCVGGWTLVLVYEYPAGPDPAFAPAYRSVRLFDGLAGAGSGPVQATADGFRVATDGAPVSSKVGLVAYGADRDTGTDALSVNGVGTGDDAADAIVAGSAYGAPLDAVGPTRPNYLNSLGYDSRPLDLPATALPPGTTTAATTLTSGGPPVVLGALLLVSRVDQLLTVAASVARADGTAAGYADVTPGTRLRYTLTLRALAPVTDVAVTVALPAGLAPVADSLTLNGATADAGTLSGTTVQVTLPGLDPGTIAVVGYDVTPVNAAPAGQPLVNRATVRFASGGVPLLVYSAPTTVIANRVDLALTQTTSAPGVSPGRPALLTITVSNAGRVAATGVTVLDKLPDALALVSAHAAQGSYDPGTGNWSIGALATGASATLQLVVAPGTASGGPTGGTPAPSAAPTVSTGTLLTFPVVNTAEISGGDQPDLDSLAGDGLSGEDDQAAVTLTVTAPAGVSAVPSTPDGVQAAVPHPKWLKLGDVVTMVIALVGAALLVLGMMVLVSARRRHG